MKAIMISIRPKWVAKILNGEKTIEIRKTMPKCELPVEVYIYCVKGKAFIDWQRIFTNHIIFGNIPYHNGKVVAKFTLNKVEEIHPYKKWNSEDDYDMIYEEGILKKSCLIDKELGDYLYSKDGKGYAWHIDDLDIFDEPKKLSDYGLTKAPQSWCYVEDRNEKNEQLAQ